MKEQVPTYQLLSGRSETSVKLVYERYGKKLFVFAKQKWRMNEDDAWDVVYKTLYRVIDTHSSYQFVSEEKFSAFVFTIFINYLRNFYRDRKNLPGEIVELDERVTGDHSSEKNPDDVPSPAMQMLMNELDGLEDWERILLLMRSQDIPYSKIAGFVQRPEEQLKVYYQRLKKKLSDRMNEKLKQTDLNTPEHGK
ncbi:MAG TPA: sigma-70 family RNA polymerase sigma factor [Bacteroidia bacterium]|jgi:RNA polymerase sigma factor (sigma-70 family)|nr:sigma-70 family RNA polymerase sigma factor [Bacteroidia bacterium]